MPKLSIITISYNNKAGLESTVKSVIGQTFTDFEYIVIDGGSNDGSADILKANTSKINYWVSEKDSGIYNAMNKGLQKATGEYCLFLNSGDYLYTQSVLEDVFKRNYSEDILYGEIIFHFAGGKEELGKLPEKLSIEYLFDDNIWHPAAFIKRELFSKIGLYNENFKIAADYDFFFHAIAIKKISNRYLPFPIVMYNTTGISSLPGNMQQIITERRKIHDQYLSKEEYIYLSNVKKIKNTSLAKWLVGKPFLTKLFFIFYSIRSKLIK